MRLTVGTDAPDTARLAAEALAGLLDEAARQRGRAAIALSGGETPWLMLAALRSHDLPWHRLHVAQVDERAVADGDPLRNLRRLHELLVRDGPLPATHLHAMPVTEPDLEAAARSYQATLEKTLGSPVVFDVVQLGLGDDGHTASLVPGDPALDVVDRDVTVSGEYRGARRMTLTFPALNRARQRLWLVTGAAKSRRLGDLLEPRGAAPSQRVSRDAAIVFADAAASGGVSPA